jgi:hypothetical protein
MSQADCLGRIPAFGEDQPNVMAWSDWRGGCHGAQGVFPANGGANLLYTDASGIGANDIDVMWIPPNVVSTLNTDGRNGGQGTVIGINGLGTAGSEINYPGLYSFDQGVADQYGRGTRMGLNDVDIVSNATTRPWADHLYDCCSGQITDTRLCGNYQPGAAVCKSRLQSCDGGKLKTDDSCQTMCRADPVTCDKVKYKFCVDHPTDRFCSCMNVEDNPDYQKLESRIIAKTGQAPRLACSPFGRCQTGTDLLDIYLPTTILNDRANVCPSYSSYLDQSVTTTGSGNVVNTTQTGTQGTTGGTQGGSSGSSGQGTSTSTSGIQEIPVTGDNNILNLSQGQGGSTNLPIVGSTNNLLIIFLVFIVAISIGYFVFAPSKPAYPYPYPYPYPYQS